MGRVRRYKKFKSCDPYAKKSNSSSSNSNHDYDEPPDLFDERKQQWKTKKDKILEKTMGDFNHHEMKIIKANLKTNTIKNTTTTSITTNNIQIIIHILQHSHSDIYIYINACVHIK